jgi:multidrug resistance efflux pump
MEWDRGQRRSQLRKGDVLAKIDPQLYQAALDKAKGRKEQCPSTFRFVSR